MKVASKTPYGAGALYQGEYHGEPIILLRTGMGAKNAASATEFLLAHYPVSHLLVSGYCGGLASHIHSGDAVVASSLGELGEDAVDFSLKIAASTQLTTLLSAHDIPCHEGAMLQSKSAVRSSVQKKQLYEKHDALAVDMESYTVLQVVEKFEQSATKQDTAKIASFVLRFVVDSAEHELADTQSFVNEQGWVKPLQLAGEMLKSPRLIKDLSALEQLASTARAQLAKSIPIILKEIEKN